MSSSRWRPRPLSALLLVVLLLGTTVMAFIVDRVVADQEERLLDREARSAGAFVSSAFTGMLSSFPLLGTLAAPELGGAALFSAVARPMASDGGSLVLVHRVADGFVVDAAEGDGPTPGSLVGPRIGALAARAAGADGPVSDVFTHDSHRHWTFAVKSATNRDVVVYADFLLERTQFEISADDPFSELDGALYVGKRATPERLMLATSDTPLTGDPVVRRMVTVGADEWLLVVTPKHSLVGGFAERLPWVVFAAGVIAALLATALVELVSRRRSYALRLVEERTRELEAARAAAEEASRSKSEFLSRMSHELRTPLNAVLGFAQLLESDDLTSEQRAAVKQILHGGRHLLNLINEVLDITRIETGSFLMSLEPVPVVEVVDEVLDLIRPLAVTAGVDVSRRDDVAELYVWADRQRLKQVLLNLVANAVKYNRRGGTVTISCSGADESDLRISVHDTGPGIPAEQLPLLFMPFERLGAERTSVEGTGVGLALSRRLAEAMSGTVDVETASGQGSTFWVQLPVAESPLEGAQFVEDIDAIALGGVDAQARRKLLYIEDNLPNQRLIEQIFARQSDIELLVAPQGRLGLDLAQEHRPAMVLLDLHLPDLTGSEVLRELRDDPRTSAIPVVVISADATAGQVERLLAEGARAYLTKPLDVAELRRLVDELSQPV